MTRGLNCHVIHKKKKKKKTKEMMRIFYVNPCTLTMIELSIYVDYTQKKKKKKYLCRLGDIFISVY
jgi:hypothetical protein